MPSTNRRQVIQLRPLTAFETEVLMGLTAQGREIIKHIEGGLQDMLQNGASVSFAWRLASDLYYQAFRLIFETNYQGALQHLTQLRSCIITHKLDEAFEQPPGRKYPLLVRYVLRLIALVSDLLCEQPYLRDDTNVADVANMIDQLPDRGADWLQKNT
jgi:hypothetical protein